VRPKDIQSILRYTATVQSFSSIRSVRRGLFVGGEVSDSWLDITRELVDA
jgi:hypothetical protein